MKTEEYFKDDCDRYHFDFGECSYENGFCQIDTTQDASYYGNWINLTDRKAVTYAEGDVRYITFDTDDEMVAWLTRFKDHKALGFIHIDPGLNAMYDRVVEQCKQLGITHMLPKSCKESLCLTKTT
jgi:hypothetical protein